ncbi:MAG: amidohydrolase family protein [Planctomycetota bacterium]|nr:amidohydrolase family protein [Planctomycetota bacterium]
MLLLLAAFPLDAQETPNTEPANGPRRLDPAWHALVGATVHVQPGETKENATVVWRRGKIVSVGTKAAPAGARVWDAKGLHVYPGLIDAYVEVAAPAPDAKAPGVHWNPRVTPQRSALDGTGPNTETRKELRKAGFTAAAIAPKGGIFRGTAALVSLAEPDDDASRPRPPVYKRQVYQSVGLERTRNGRDGYPTSQMGAIAVIRQALYDHAWPGRKPGALDALSKDVPLLFDTEDELEALRTARIAREFHRPAVLLGSGMEFRRLDAIARDRLPIVIPLAYPRRPRVDTFGDADAVDLRTLMTWEQAPTNPRRLAAAGLSVSLTTSKLRRRRMFHRRLREAIRHGLTEDQALAMLTTNPARLLGATEILGTIEPGKQANLVVCDGPLFSKKTKIRVVWIDGRRHEVTAPPEPDVIGRWQLSYDTPENEITFFFAPKEAIRVVIAGKEQKAKHVELEEGRLSFSFKHTGGLWTVSGTVDGERISGEGLNGAGAVFHWTAQRTGPGKEKAEKGKKGRPPKTPVHYGTPFGAYGLDAPPAPEQVRVVGATLWTCGPLGTIKNGELRVVGGKIVYAGPRIDEETAADFVEIDAGGKHVTPGLIDCHSHTGISKGINDSGQAVTAEVRIADVTNPDSISWYRQLAGGITCVNSLHGSANPIGGQNCVNKVRWGCVHPDDMHFAAAPQGIKFALGENVKQSNWGDKNTTRYPQTRMGVETLMRDRFLAARGYAKKWTAHKKDPKAHPQPRRDLELDALAEILAGTRLIHCHSYRQDEILMLCRLAEDFGFKIGTFQHVLEGYKVADAIRDRALGASAFSDWWAYKVEVQDAIPHNGAIMHEVGVVVSFNSDSDDLARRMNVEAAKAVKYGGVSEDEALKFVTLNPAIQLGIEKNVGSLEKGKDADFVLWSGHPLSTLTRCEGTWVDGRRLFWFGRDLELRRQAASERRRIIQKLLGGEREEIDDDEEDEKEGRKGRRRRRRRPVEEFDDHRCGECGCAGLEGVR